MKITDFLMLLGGLSLFLYGMDMMSKGLEAAAGNKLKNILEKLTSSRLRGVLVGIGITAIIQSSSATTVMTVGFVNSGLMTISQAVGVIMGANIGTTVTGQLIALDIGTIAYLISFAGVLTVMFAKRKSLSCTGQIVAGLGILFIGMETMGAAMEPLSESQSFISIMTSFSNPMLGVLAGAVFTGIIQSSSASVGILQALAKSGLIGLNSSVYVLFGQNIGTCVTAVLASIGTNRNARRVAVIHLLFNFIGTVIFVIICSTTEFTDLMISLTPDNPAAQIANTHTVFNVVTTLILLPMGGFLAKLSLRILPGDDEEKAPEMKLKYFRGVGVGSTAIAVNELVKETKEMYAISRDNLKTALNDAIAGNRHNFNKINQNEEYINYLNTEIVRNLSYITANGMDGAYSHIVNGLFRMTSDIERIGDHAVNIAEFVQEISDKEIKFSEEAIGELMELRQVLNNIFAVVDSMDFDETCPELLKAVYDNEERIDSLTESFRRQQIDRMKKSICSAEGGVIYSEFLTDIERVSDHMLNIAQAVNES